ncbi:unnamed protein product [Prunus armeniaca]
MHPRAGYTCLNRSTRGRLSFEAGPAKMGPLAGKKGLVGYHVGTFGGKRKPSLPLRSTHRNLRNALGLLSSDIPFLSVNWGPLILNIQRTDGRGSIGLKVSGSVECAPLTSAQKLNG